jgi:hypothetical protein
MPFDGVEVSQVTERLIIGRARIEAGWCQGALNRLRFDWRGWHHEYCLVGAVRGDWTQDHTRKSAIRLMARAICDLGYGKMQPSVFNDSHTKAQVLEVCDVAIAMSRGDYRSLERRNP